MTARLAREAAGIDWGAVAASLEERGHAVVPGVVGARDCRDVIAMYDDDRRFRSRIVMERHDFGRGEYSYFDAPLPPLVARLRRDLYPGLAPVANRMAEAMGRPERFPPDLDGFLARCRAAGQTRPTPLVLRYEAGGFNCLHRDLYGEVAFPLQAVVMLSRPGEDFAGGELVLVENRPRRQSRAAVIAPGRGDLVIFPVAERPVPGKRRTLRASVRHGVSPVHSGSRLTLGIIFHDAA